MPVAKAGATYFLLAFAAGWILGPIRELLLTPRFGPTVAVLIEAPLMLAACLLAARWTVRRFAIRPLGLRIGIGLTGLALLLVAEFSLGAIMRGQSAAEHLANYGTPAGIASLGMFAIFAALPAWLLPRQRQKD